MLPARYGFKRRQTVKSRVLGKNGVRVSEIGLGCWQLGGDFGPLGHDRAQAILREAHRSGISFWDTADVYGGGQSELRIAEFVNAHRVKPFIATKVGRDPALYPDGYTREKVRKNIEGSARRLGADAVDLVQLHCVPSAVLKAGDIISWMEDFQKQGLIRSFGASVETIDEARFAAQSPHIVSLQIIFNIFRQNAIDELFPLAEANDVGIIVRLPLASGVLSGKMSHGQKFAETDHRNYNRKGEAFSVGETFSGVPFDTAVDLVEELKSLVPAGMTMAQMAMRWILDHPAVTTVIAGASRPEQVLQNASVSSLPPLPQALHRELAEFYRRKVELVIQVPV
jgi:aryl-alcohol dehydrogenase-like predicted oxidoreductase